MREEKIAEMLALHLEDNGVGTEAGTAVVLSEEARKELDVLLRLARHLEGRMQPVAVPPAFARSLGRELVEEAERHIAMQKRRHRIAMISAAAAGAVVSVASVVGGIVMLIKWLRGRAEGRQVSAA